MMSGQSSEENIEKLDSNQFDLPIPIMAKTPAHSGAQYVDTNYNFTAFIPVINEGRESEEEENEEMEEDEDGGGRFFDASAPFDFKEQDRLLPYANIERIMKKTVEMFNKSAKISKEAKECMQECVTEFICFVTGEASDLCLDEKRKTVAGEDVLNALEKLGFENYCGALKECLNKHRESIKNEKKGSASGKSKKKPSKSSKNSKDANY